VGEGEGPGAEATAGGEGGWGQENGGVEPSSFSASLAIIVAPFALLTAKLP
jgi:hypothetical protein